MDKKLRNVHRHMLGLGLGALAHANWHGNYYSQDNEYWSELSVIQAGHAAEILIKARIAQEHPLLIFETLPKPTGTDSKKLELKDLIETGRTYQYADLPDRLWATTGIRIPNLSLYKEFGRLRNAINHFAHPKEGVGKRVSDFVFGVIDPFINKCWDLYAVDFNEDHEEYTYFVAGLIQNGIRFLVSPRLAENGFEYIELNWPSNDPSYRSDMEKRIKAAQKKLKKG